MPDVYVGHFLLINRGQITRNTINSPSKSCLHTLWLGSEGELVALLRCALPVQFCFGVGAFLPAMLPARQQKLEPLSIALHLSQLLLFGTDLLPELLLPPQFHLFLCIERSSSSPSGLLHHYTTSMVLIHEQALVTTVAVSCWRAPRLPQGRSSPR